MKYTFRHILTIVFLLTAVSLFSQTENELKKRKADTEKEIAKIDKQINENAKAKRTKSTQITLLNNRIEQRKKLINDTDIQIAITESEIQKKNKKVNEIKSQINRLKDSYSELVVNIYINRKKATWLMYVFASEDFSQAYRRLKYLQSYADVVFVQAKKIEQTNQQLSKEISLLHDKKQELDLYKSERKRDVENLAKDEYEAKKILAGLKSEEKTLKKQLQRKRNDLTNLNKQIEDILKKEIEKNKSTGISKMPENVKLSADFAANRGRLPWPVKQGKIVSFFGNHTHPIFKHLELPENRGIDIETAEGENALAVFDGVVTTVFSIPGMNVGVFIKHGEYYSLYCRLRNSIVKTGDNVKTGTVIGKIITTTDGSQLHFELWKNTTNFNPLLWLAKK
ncbi:MAG: peptidoglycan DD-metalloendopeptidase family protein [Prevotellaceae bacterium]|jgi:murein DD-endopeptidase MepM/ murein hydrolase activator NlpD|nr:peptidoglycan DD-metalloendopeptidase family protein [Prevotellaceae bacterium]